VNHLNKTAPQRWPNGVNFRHKPGITRPVLRPVRIGLTAPEADIMNFVKVHNENPRPYRWTKSADQILASVKRFCRRVEHNLCAEL
jgi:hypothetical protein